MVPRPKKTRETHHSRCWSLGYRVAPSCPDNGAASTPFQVLPQPIEFSFKFDVAYFVLYIRPVLSSSKALGLTAQSLHRCCKAQCSRAMNRVPRGEKLDLCLQVTLVHGSAVSTATPKRPKINLLHV